MTAPTKIVPVTQAMVHAFYSATEVTREGTILRIEDGIRDAIAAAPAPSSEGLSADLRKQRVCRRCSCSSCGREGAGELHDHVCTDGDGCVETRDKLRAKTRSLRWLCASAADEIDSLKAENAHWKANHAGLVARNAALREEVLERLLPFVARVSMTSKTDEVEAVDTRKLAKQFDRIVDDARSALAKNQQP